jgi:hypothetical protein
VPIHAGKHLNNAEPYLGWGWYPKCQQYTPLIRGEAWIKLAIHRVTRRHNSRLTCTEFLGLSAELLNFSATFSLSRRWRRVPHVASIIGPFNRAILRVPGILKIAIMHGWNIWEIIHFAQWNKGGATKRRQKSEKGGKNLAPAQYIIASCRITLRLTAPHQIRVIS